jgi:beta-phosphoglucomutase
MLPDLFKDIRGAIFDMDGTIVDSMKLHKKVWQEIAKKYGRKMSLQETSDMMHGINSEILERIFPDKLTEQGKQKIADEKENLFRKRFDPEQHVIKGLIQLLQQLKYAGIPCAIGSAAPPENIDFVLDALGIRAFFKGVIHEDHVVAGKPNPDVFIKAARLMNVPVNDCVVFEDSTSGAEASAAAGSKTIVLLTSKSRDDFDGTPGIIGYCKNYGSLLEMAERER